MAEFAHERAGTGRAFHCAMRGRGRQARARLLAPSFLVVASVAACGPTSITQEGDGGAGRNANAVGNGATGGSGAVHNTAGVGGSYGGVGGSIGGGGNYSGIGGSNPPCTMLHCPATAPVDGSSCDPRTSGEQVIFCAVWPPECNYPATVCGDVRATCVGQIWEVIGACGGEAGAGGASGEGGAVGEAGAPVGGEGGAAP